jgi:2',3'-cyclic-nucleotide 2'-phosphodiesterase (5'-nucleotidase family)
MLQRFLTLFLTGALALGVAGCPSDDDDDNPVDTGVADTGSPADTGMTDTGSTDTGAPDTGAPDTGMPDTGTPDAGDGPQTMTFLHTNDEHSQHLGRPNIDDFPALSGDESVKGGVYRRARTLEILSAEAQAMNLPVAIVNAGDVSMGSLFHVANLVASPDYNILTQLGYDVGTLGNHEFDFGVATLSSMIQVGDLIPGMPPAFGVLGFPLVVSNIRFSMTSGDDDGLAGFWSESFDPDQPIVRYYISDFDGVRIGFVGYMGIEAALVAPFKSPVTFSLATNATACTSDADCPGSICVPPADDPVAISGNCAVDPSGADVMTNFPKLVEDVASAVAAVRAQNVDLVVAVSHAGVNEQELNMLAAMGMGPENARASEDILVALGVDQALAANSIPGIDVIIGGHSHTPLPAPLQVPNAQSGITTFIAQGGSYGNFVGKLRVSRTSRSANWTLDEGYSGLEAIDGTVNAQGLGFLTQLVLDGLIDQVIDFMEADQLAQPGDGLLFPGEQCDGTVLPNQGSCVGLVPGATGGTLGCLPNQQVNLSLCTIPSATCGNNTTEAPELCDGTSLPMTCADLGYEGGNIGCFANCAFDFTNCQVHFPSLLEAALNFQLLPGDPEIRDNPAMMGDLFFYDLGATAFDIGETTPNNESNLANLVADSARWAVNTLDDDAVGNPVEIAITANGVVRDGIYRPLAGDVLSFADLFRVMSLGVSPQESTPGYTLVDFFLTAPEIKAGLEVGLSNGLVADSFWLQVSGARIEYDLSLPAFDPANPTTTGRITKIEIIDPAAGDDPWDDALATYEPTPLFDRSLGAGAFPDPTRLVHLTTSVYISLFMEGFGLCPRSSTGVQSVACRACTMDNECTPGTCDQTAGRCTGLGPAGFSSRTQVPLGNGFFQELKEVLALTTFIRRLPGPGNIPVDYDGGTPRRICCVGTMCPADNSRSCN